MFCLCFRALCEWQFGKVAPCQVNATEAISLAKELNDMHALALAFYFAWFLAHFEFLPGANNSENLTLLPSAADLKT